MTYLGISTSQSNATVALKYNDSIKQLEFQKGYNSVCETIMPNISQLLEKFNISQDKLQVIGVDVGPGSFTGIRIGIATANALALALNIPVVSFSSLDLIACEYFHNKTQSILDFIVGINAGREQIYGAGYKINGNSYKKVLEDNLFSKDTFLKESKDKTIIGLNLEKLEIKAINIAPQAITCFTIMKTSEIDMTKNTFALPHYIRLSDAELKFRKKV